MYLYIYIYILYVIHHYTCLIYLITIYIYIYILFFDIAIYVNIHEIIVFLIIYNVSIYIYIYIHYFMYYYVFIYILNFQLNCPHISVQLFVMVAWDIILFLVKTLSLLFVSPLRIRSKCRQKLHQSGYINHITSAERKFSSCEFQVWNSIWSICCMLLGSTWLCIWFVFDPLSTHPKRPFPCHGGVSKHPWRCLDQATHLWTDRGGLGDLMVGFLVG